MTRSKFTWLLISLILCGFIITSFVSYRVAHKALEDQIKRDSLPLTSDNIYSEIQHDLVRPIFISSLMAQDTFVRNWTIAGEQDPEAIIQYLDEIRKQYGTVTSFFISDKTHNYYHYSGLLKQISQQNPSDAWYFRVKEQDPENNYEVNIDHDTAQPEQIVVFVNYRVYDFQHNFLGVIGVGLSSDAVATIIEKYKQRYQREIYFINESGDVTLHGAQPMSFDVIQDKEGLKDFTTQILTSSSSSGSYSSNGEEFYFSSRWVDEFQWYLMVQQKDKFNNQIFIKTLLCDFSISIIVAFLVIFIAQFSFRSYQTRLEQMAIIDKLTKTYNRQAFDDIVTKVFKSNNLCSVALLDIDHFKQVNDTYGHQIGDHVLQRVAQECRHHLGDTASICRWGGEEFIILLPGYNAEQARHTLDTLRHSIEHHPVKPNVSVSIGIAERHGIEKIEALIHRADMAMYQAKQSGRNQVCISRNEATA